LTRARNLLDPERENPILAEDISIQKQLKDKQHQIMNLYYKILEELLVQEERKTRKPNLQEILRNENFHRALLACSIEVVFFINNYSNLSFQKLLDLCKIPAFEFWRIISSFMTFDPKMPHALKKHFYDIELRIIMKLAWKKDSSILEVLTNLVPNLNPSNFFYLKVYL